MGELLRVYGLEGNFLYVQDRDEYYREIRQEWEQTGQITRQVEVVRFFLMTTLGRIYIQLRSKTKSENPGLFDKTVGGHVKAGYSVQMTAFLECQEELAIPMAVWTPEESRIVIAENDMRVSGMMWRIGDTNAEISIRKFADGSHIGQPVIAHYFVGYYDGSIRFKDGESSGVQVFNRAELESLMSTQPEAFTSDLHYMTEKFGNHLVSLQEYLKRL